MDAAPRFEIEIAQNKHLPPTGTEVHAAVTVTAAGAAAPAAGVAQVIVIDTSGSMGAGTKLVAAQRATLAAIDALRDDALFAVVSGHTVAEMVYPPTAGMVAADAEHRRAARRAVARLSASGGTSMADWLDFVRRLLAAHPDGVRHAILLTDGLSTQTAGELTAAIARAAPVFDCDARGIGADWSPAELLRITAALRGKADAVRGAAELVADFAAMTEAVMGKLVPEVRVRVQPSQWARPLFLKQTHPTDAELLEQADGPRAVAYSTGAWGAETRRFHLALAVERGSWDLEQDRRAAGVHVQARAVGGAFAKVSEVAAVEVRWTRNALVSSQVDPSVADFTDQRDMAEAVNRGCAAYRADDVPGAEAAWREAVVLAAGLDHAEMLDRLRNLVDITGDPRDGVVRARPGLTAVDMLAAVVGSSHSSSIHPVAPRPRPTGPRQTRRCANPACAAPENPSTAAFCGACGTALPQETT
ncbi:VWA domain-containing protein [Actinokineospora sp. G85]|uniref:VWA domain-containing protein n=1 Tax=Actinokineospora sp. G85 TaxID=3406626 RepID=UPI003C785BF0